MPTRLLREGINDSAAVNSLSPRAEVFYRRLMSVVDDFGRYDARPAVLRSRLYPLQLDSVRESDIPRWIAECVKVGLISLYVVDSRPYLVLHKLGSRRAKRSKWPEPPADLESQSADANTCAQMLACATGSSSSAHSGSGSGSSAKNAGGGHPPTPRDGPGPTPEEFAEAWNSLPEPFPRVLRMSSGRAKALKERRQDAFWRERWRAALDLLPERPFLRGEGDKGWVADVDFFLRPDTVQKILEGKYADGAKRNGFGGSANGHQRPGGSLRSPARVDCEEGRYGRKPTIVAGASAPAQPDPAAVDAT